MTRVNLLHNRLLGRQSFVADLIDKYVDLARTGLSIKGTITTHLQQAPHNNRSNFEYRRVSSSTNESQDLRPVVESFHRRLFADQV